MFILRNACANCKYVSYCTRASRQKSTYPGGVAVEGPLYSRHGRNYQESGLWPPNLPPKVLLFQRWNSGIPSWKKGGHSDKYEFLRSSDDERDSIELTDDIFQEGGEGISEIPLSAKQLRKERREFKKKVPVGEAVIHTLQSVFGMTRHEALKTVFSPKLFLVADAAVIKTLHCLKDFDISARTLQGSPWILLQTAGEVKEKIRMLSAPYLFQNHFDGLGFCHFPVFQIRQYQKLFESEWEHFPEHTNRIYYMADHLRVPVDRLTEKIVKVRRLLSMNFYRVEHYIELLNKYEVHHEDILGDLWIFFNNINLAERRLQAIIDAGCKRPKLWMCRCPEDVFAKTLYRYQTQRDALGDCSSLQEYLMKRLNCTFEELECQFEFDLALKKMSVAKAQRVLDLLFSENFTASQIRCGLRVLKYSEKRTSMRLKRLKDVGLTSIPITVLYKSPRHFEAYCELVKKK